MDAVYKDQFLEVNGSYLHYQDWGNKGADPLVMVHGLSRNSHDFDPVARQFEKWFHPFALDVRGRGDSAWSSGETYNNPQYVKDLIAWLDHLGVEKFHYIGTSMGAIIGMFMALSHPERLHSMVINDIGPVIDASGLARIQAYLTKAPKSFASLEEAAEYHLDVVSPWRKNVPRKEYIQSMIWNLKQGPDGRFGYKYDPQISSATAPPSPHQLENLSKVLWEGFKAISCPMMLIRGGESDLLSLETVAEMKDAKPQMKVVEVPGVGHAPSLDEPEAVRGLEAFYSECRTC